LAPHFNAGVMPHPGQAENRQERVPVDGDVTFEPGRQVKPHPLRHVIA